MAHSRVPSKLFRSHGFTAQPPLSKEIGQSLTRNFHYLNSWAQNYQIFTFAQPALDLVHGDQSGSGSSYVDGYYYVVCWVPPKADTTNPTRQIHGALLPWASYGDYDHADEWDSWPVITWQQEGGALATVYDDKNHMMIESIDPVTHSIDINARLNWSDAILLPRQNLMEITPDASGGYVLCRLVTHQIRTAALGLWMGPDSELTTAQAQIDKSKMGVGHGIRGYNSDSIDQVVHRMGIPTGQNVASDYLCENGRRVCLMQWGHPQGIWCDKTSETYIARSTDTYRIPPIGWYHSSYSAATTDVSIAVVCTVVGKSSESTDASIIVEAVGSTDTVELNYVSDTSGWPDVRRGKLMVNTAGDALKISMINNEAGEIILHTFSVWDKTY